MITSFATVTSTINRNVQKFNGVFLQCTIYLRKLFSSSKFIGRLLLAGGGRGEPKRRGEAKRPKAAESKRPPHQIQPTGHKGVDGPGHKVHRIHRGIAHLMGQLHPTLPHHLHRLVDHAHQALALLRRGARHRRW